VQEFVYRNIKNVEQEMYDFNCNKLSHRNNKKRFKEKIGSHFRRTFDTYNAKDSYTGNRTQYGKFCRLTLEA
jgi:hypothetical protein